MLTSQLERQIHELLIELLKDQPAEGYELSVSENSDPEPGTLFRLQPKKPEGCRLHVDADPDANWIDVFLGEDGHVEVPLTWASIWGKSWVDDLTFLVRSAIEGRIVEELRFIDDRIDKSILIYSKTSERRVVAHHDADVPVRTVVGDHADPPRAEDEEPEHVFVVARLVYERAELVAHGDRRNVSA